MSAILLTKGPVCTYRAIHTNGPKKLRNIKKSLFLEAADCLQRAALGELVCINRQEGGLGTHVFVKVRPEAVEEPLLAGNHDLCLVEKYRKNFGMPSPGCISEKIREKLVDLGYVLQEDFVPKPGVL